MYLEAFGANTSLRECSRRVRGRTGSSDRYCPYTWIWSFIFVWFVATHSFICIMFVRLSRPVVQTLEPGLAVTTPVGKIVVFGCPVSICRRVLPVNIVVLPMISYDVILGMDWLAKYLRLSTALGTSYTQALGRRRSYVYWIVSLVITSNYLGRLGQEAHSWRRTSIFGICCHPGEGSKERLARYPYCSRLPKCLFNRLL